MKSCINCALFILLVANDAALLTLTLRHRARTSSSFDEICPSFLLNIIKNMRVLKYNLKEGLFT
jgi:hypothetical protein